MKNLISLIGNVFTPRKDVRLILSGSFIVFGFVIALLTSSINYQLESTNIDAEMRDRAEQLKSRKYELLNIYARAIENQVKALAENPVFLDYLATGTDDSHRQASYLFLAITKAHINLMQVRYIDAEGYEKIRINRNKPGKSVYIVNNENLQFKGERYYFTEVKKLHNNSFWHSALDLNFENGQLEKPVRPTYRVAAPVYADGQFNGLIIFNLEATELLERITQSTIFDIMIVDGDGEVLVNPDASLSWSRYFPENPNLGEIYPDLKDDMLNQSNPITDEFEVFSIDGLLKNDQKLKIIVSRKKEVLAQLVNTNLAATALITIIVIALSLPLSWMAALFPAKLQKKLHNALGALRSTNDVLDRFVMLLTFDKEGKITEVSEAFCQKSGYTPKQIVGQNVAVNLHPEVAEEVTSTQWANLSQGRIWYSELRHQTREGEEYWVNSVISPKYNTEGEIESFAQILQDISDKKVIEKLSITDQLTQIFNRRKLDELLNVELKRASRSEQTFSLILMDIDHFKQVNDKYGHQAGDKVLVETARVLCNSIREIDFIGRWGGEEFLVICPSTNGAGASVLAEKLRSSLASFSFGKGLSVTASFGVAEWQKNENQNQVIVRADSALYRSKSQGRNQVTLDETTKRDSF